MRDDLRHRTAEYRKFVVKGAGGGCSACLCCKMLISQGRLDTEPDHVYGTRCKSCVLVKSDHRCSWPTAELHRLGRIADARLVCGQQQHVLDCTGVSGAFTCTCRNAHLTGTTTSSDHALLSRLCTLRVPASVPTARRCFSRFIKAMAVTASEKVKVCRQLHEELSPSIFLAQILICLSRDAVTKKLPSAAQQQSQTILA